MPKGFQEKDLKQYHGFVYLITCIKTKKKYIGRKYLWKKVKKKGKKVTVESDWRTYKSSCDPLKADILQYGVEAFTFEILSFYKSKGQVNYSEIKEQFSRDVLYSKLPSGEFEYYNTCILNRYWRRLDND